MAKESVRLLSFKLCLFILCNSEFVAKLHSQDFVNFSSSMNRYPELNQCFHQLNIKPKDVLKLIISNSDSTVAWTHNFGGNEKWFVKNSSQSVFPSGLNEFVNLKALRISGLGLRSIPKEISTLKNLEYLDLSLNLIEDELIILEQLKHLENLKTVCLYGSKVSESLVNNLTKQNIQVLYLEEHFLIQDSSEVFSFSDNAVYHVKLNDYYGPSGFCLINTVREIFDLPDSFMRKQDPANPYRTICYNPRMEIINQETRLLDQLSEKLLQLPFVNRVFIDKRSDINSISITLYVSRDFYKGEGGVVLVIQVSPIVNLYTYYFDINTKSYLDQFLDKSTIDRSVFGRNILNETWKLHLRDLEQIINLTFPEYNFSDFGTLWKTRISYHPNVVKKFNEFGFKDVSILDQSKQWNCYQLLFDPKTEIDESKVILN